jgi:hypothetical protein
MIAIANDHMVNHINFEQLTAANEVAGDFNVRFGRLRFSARMIVHDNDGGCAGHDCQTENFPRMAKNGVHRSHGYKIVTFDFTAGVQELKPPDIHIQD